MRAKNKSYSIIIVSDATSTNKELVLSSKFIRNSLIAVVLLVALFGYLGEQDRPDTWGADGMVSSPPEILGWVA